MTDKEVSKLKKRILPIAKKWANALGLNWYRMHYEWINGHKEGQHKCGAEVDMSWEYQEHTVRFFLPMLQDQTDEELEEIIVHEFAHILTCPLMYEDTETGRKVYEYVTTRLQKALLWVREGGQRGDL